MIITGCSKRFYETKNYDDIQTMIANKDSFVYFIGTSSCSSCKTFKDNLKEAGAQKDMLLYYVDANELTSSQLKSTHVRISSLLPDWYFVEHSYNVSSFYTPSIIKYIDGSSVYSIIGEMSTEKILELYDFNFIDIGFYNNFVSHATNLEDFIICFYDDGDEIATNYATTFRTYVNENNKKSYYIKASNLRDKDKTDLLEIVNANLEEKIEVLPKQITLNYFEGKAKESYLTVLDATQLAMLYK